MQSYVLMLQTDIDDKELTESVLLGIDLPLAVKFLENVDELPAFTDEYGKPVLILINENTKCTGIEVVKQLKNDPSYNYIPLIILKENTLAKYVSDCYQAGANSVITKPSSVELTQKKIEAFFTYWFTVADLPQQTEVVSR